MAFPGKATHT